MTPELRQKLTQLEHEWGCDRIEADINDSRRGFVYWLVNSSGWKLEAPPRAPLSLPELVKGVSARAERNPNVNVELTDHEYDTLAAHVNKEPKQ